jgi:anthranilate/para-aminobenzoate synthase component I
VRVPHVVEVRDTGFDPLAVYETLRREYPSRDSFLLESALRSRQTGRFSLVGAAAGFFRSRGNTIDVVRGGRAVSYQGDPFAEMEKILAPRRGRTDANIPFIGGAVGFFSYDINRLFQKLPLRDKEPSGCPDMYLMLVDDCIIFDHDRRMVVIVSRYDPAFSASANAAVSAADFLRSVVRRSPAGERPRYTRDSAVGGDPFGGMPARTNLSKNAYMDMVRRAKEYIRAGDIYQANLSQRFDVTSDADGLLLYRVLRDINPSPFASYLRCGETEIISCSPERLVKREGNFIESRPIAGTRPRGAGIREDVMMKSELLLSEKERAEHIMLVDLERNDIGRVSLAGSVEVDEFMVVEPYSHVQHIVSNVRGMTAAGVGLADILRAVFPGGTITGVPKIRCMEIIDELEPSCRGLYTGSIGYISDSGDLDLNIAIRTIVKKGDTCSVQVGAGIVADSDPQSEYDETLYKAGAMIDALRIAQNNDKLILQDGNI